MTLRLREIVKSMYLRKVENPHYDIQKATEKVDGVLSKVYTFIAIGWLVEIVGFSAEKVNYSGTQFAILNPNAFPGVIYIVCLLLYAKFIFSAFYFGIVAGLNNRSMTKRAMRVAWLNVRKYRNSKNQTDFRLNIILAKKLAKSIWIIWASLLATAILFPILYIILFRIGAVISALKGVPVGQP